MEPRSSLHSSCLVASGGCKAELRPHYTAGSVDERFDPKFPNAPSQRGQRKRLLTNSGGRGHFTCEGKLVLSGTGF